MKFFLLVCLATLAYSYAQEKEETCVPEPKVDPDVQFGADLTAFNYNEYEKSKGEAEEEAETTMARTIGSSAMKSLKHSASCDVTAKKQSLNQVSIWGDWWYVWKRACEPCKSQSVYYDLWRFYSRRCFVIMPFWQRIRTVRCSYKPCASPCSCGNTKCLPTDYQRVWFFGWCHSYYGGWRPGFNYHYLYLPQDCTCHQQVFYRRPGIEKVDVIEADLNDGKQ